MRLLVSLLSILVCVRAAAETPTVELEASGLDDELGLLYSSQVQFGLDGLPLVTIGLMDGQQTVSVSSSEGLTLSGRVERDGQLVRKTIRSEPGQTWIFEPLDPTPALVQYWCAVESWPFSDGARLEKAVEHWRRLGAQSQVFEVGSVFGIRGHVIDNRTYILGIQSFSSEKEAEEAGRDVFERHGVQSFVHAHLACRPGGRLKVGPASTEKASAGVEPFVDLVEVRSIDGGPVTVHRVEHSRGYRWHGFEDRCYAGSVLVTLDREGKLVVVNRIAVDRLLEGLVPAEIFPAAPMEALKAQAVVARGEVFAKIGTRHFLDPYLLCAETHCQVYAGVKAESPRCSRAVEVTRGQLLFLGSDLVDSVYSACCGGHGEDNDAVWSDPPSPALRGKPDMASRRPMHLQTRGKLEDWLNTEPDAYCRLSSFNKKDLFRWERAFDAAEMETLVAKAKPIGRVVSIQILARGVSGRAKAVRVVGTRGDLVVQREWPIRQLFGNLRSAMFVVTTEMDDEQMVSAFRFRGGGWGHGVGMCQIGAIGMAEHGHDYRQILAHYYGGAEVFRLYGGS
ncbi:MAG: SpoIID/LytB domain-containing protein [Deltaproteobacteria bacterium]|nr:SpoIID/LytB domain-containing protein [Deltaproteobacteria bacterium]